MPKNDPVARNIRTSSEYIDNLVRRIEGVRGVVRLTQAELEFLQEIRKNDAVSVEEIEFLEMVYEHRVAANYL